jgi:hypothetical protein
VRKAVKGDIDAAKLVFDCLLGRVRTFEEITDTPPSQVVVQIVRNQPRDWTAEGIERDDVPRLKNRSPNAVGPSK